MPADPNKLRITQRSEEDVAAESRDRNLIRGLLSGDGDYLRELMGHYDALVRYAIFHACRAECARDPSFLDARAGETWSGFVESVRRRRAGPDRTLKAYLTTIARNKCADHLRKSVREPTAGGTETEVDTLAATSESDPLAAMIDFERVDALRACMVTLPKEDRKLFQELDLITQKRWAEAAARVGIPESTLRSRWSKALGRLRSCLQEKLSENP